MLLFFLNVEAKKQSIKCAIHHFKSLTNCTDLSAQPFIVTLLFINHSVDTQQWDMIRNCVSISPTVSMARQRQGKNAKINLNLCNKLLPIKLTILLVNKFQNLSTKEDYLREITHGKNSKMLIHTFNIWIWFLNWCYWWGTGYVGRTSSALSSWGSCRASCRRFLKKSPHHTNQRRT